MRRPTTAAAAASHHARERRWPSGNRSRPSVSGKKMPLWIRTCEALLAADAPGNDQPGARESSAYAASTTAPAVATPERAKIHRLAVRGCWDTRKEPNVDNAPAPIQAAT